MVSGARIFNTIPEPQLWPHLRPETIAALRVDVGRGAGHDCFEWLDRGACRLCDRTIEDLRGPKLADLEASILGFTAHGLDPYILLDGEEPHGIDDGHEPDLLVILAEDGRITDVLLTDAGLARIRLAPVRELTPSEAITAAADALSRRAKELTR